jgi:tight adherence protein C
MPVLIAVMVFGAVGLVVYAVAAHVEERSTVRASLRQLGDYSEVTSVRDRELLGPLTQRLGPAFDGVVQLGRRFTPVGYAERARKKLVITGRAQAGDLDRFLAIRVLTIVAIPVGLLLFFPVLHLHGGKGLAVFVLWAVVMGLGPDTILDRQIQERQDKIRRQLPDILDLLTISVEAGLGFEQALDRTVSNVPGDLSDEFIRMLGEVRAGASRAEAMRAIDERTDVAEVRSFVLAILQADTFGVSIGKILRAQADEMRVRRRQLAQERAQKAPVKMLIPMVTCVFPALFVVVLGPAVINILSNFKHGIGH